MREQKSSPWNSLEVAKLCCELMTPIVVAVIGFLITYRLDEQTHLQKIVTDGRAQIHSTARHGLFHIFSYIEDMNTWKEDDPDKVIAYKRSVDEAMWEQPNFWKEDTFQAYKDYMDSAFLTGWAVGKDAKIKTNADQKRTLSNWKPEWDNRLTGKVDPNHRSAYKKLQELFFRDLLQ